MAPSLGTGISQNWSSMVAAAVVVLVPVAILCRHPVSPVVLVCGVLPLGAAVAMSNMIFELMKVSSLKGEALSSASVGLASNTGKAFLTSLAIALGLGAGLAIVRFFRREGAPWAVIRDLPSQISRPWPHCPEGK